MQIDLVWNTTPPYGSPNSGPCVAPKDTRPVDSCPNYSVQHRENLCGCPRNCSSLHAESLRSATQTVHERAASHASAKCVSNSPLTNQPLYFRPTAINALVLSRTNCPEIVFDSIRVTTLARLLVCSASFAITGEILPCILAKLTNRPESAATR